MHSKATILLLSLGLLCIMLVGGPLAWRRYNFYMLTGSLFPIRRIEVLKNPVVVKGWTTNAFFLADGRTIGLPGFRTLPTNSPALAELTTRGVEVATNGHVYGLIRIRHGCGNDPVREHIVKVDISDALMFSQIGNTTKPVPAPDATLPQARYQSSEWSWGTSEFMQFQAWQAIREIYKDRAAASAPAAPKSDPQR